MILQQTEILQLRDQTVGTIQYSEKRQKLLDEYRNEFGYFNKEKISNLRDAINEK